MFNEFNKFVENSNDKDTNPNNPINQKNQIEKLNKWKEQNSIGKTEIEKTRDVINIVIINSKDRLYTNDQLTFDYKIDIMANSLTSGAISNSSNLARNLKNISSISIDNISLRNMYVDVDELHHLRDTNSAIITSRAPGSGNDSKNLRLQMLSDLPYIVIKIDDIDQTIAGSNKVINSSTGVMLIDDNFPHTNINSGIYSTDSSDNYVEYGNNGRNLIAARDRSHIYLRNSTEWQKVYFPNSRALLGSIGISFFTPQGKQIKLLNDYLTIHSIEQATITAASINSVRLTFSEFFSPEEYMIGDKIKIKDVSVRGNVSFTPALTDNSNKWQVSQTHIVSEANYTSGTGKNKGLIMKLVTDGNGDFNTTTSTILSFGPNISNGDTITLSDPGSSTNTATITIDSISADSNLQKDSFEAYLNREEGHTIINLNNSHTTSGVSSSAQLVNQIDIAYPFSINKTLGTSSISTKFGMGSASRYFLSGGTLINLNLQNLVTLKVTTKKMDDSMLAAKLI
jgi:hypothetical protein